MSENQSKDEILLQALLCGASIDAAAKKAGMSRSAGYRRLANPKFAKQYREAKAELVKRATAILSAGSLEACKSLLELTGPKNPPATRLGAARSVIELAAKLREQTEMEERMASLEQRLDADQQRRAG
ncbi:MAG: hypothetical protein K2X38_07935 [Gemmataceae bacterium]|nr:hypothetical protein [Gemmataceae bacterium]